VGLPAATTTLARTPFPEGVMDQEEAFLAALTSAASYRLADARLEFLDATGSVILTFEPPPAVKSSCGLC
jgi:hypothetical protein